MDVSALWTVLFTIGQPVWCVYAAGGYRTEHEYVVS